MKSLTTVIAGLCISALLISGCAKREMNRLNTRLEKEVTDWIFLEDSPMGTYYYNKKSLDFLSRSIARGWIKVVVDKEKRKNVIDRRRQQGIALKGDSKLSYSLILWETDCLNKKYRFLSIVEYDEDQNVLTNLSRAPEEARWNFIAPDTMEEAVAEALCRRTAEQEK